MIMSVNYFSQKRAKGVFMDKKEQLEQLRKDVLSFLDLEKYNLDAETQKNLSKGIINNFFDYLAKL